MSAHTPTPWTTSHGGTFESPCASVVARISRDPNGQRFRTVATCPHASSQSVKHGPNPSRDLAYEDAAHIVRCVNAHKELVEALQLVQRGLETGAVKAKGPVMDFSNLDVESIPMQSLSTVIDAALAKVAS